MSSTTLMKTLGIAGLLALVGCAPGAHDGDAGEEHSVLGVVAEVAPDGRTVVLSHETIPGYMQAMVMPFAVADPKLLEGLSTGDEVRFRLLVRDSGAVIDRIEKLPEHLETFPDFELEALEGHTVSSDRFAGKVVLVNFWASWCAPCRIEIPWLVEMREAYGEADFDVVGIAEDPENLQDIARLVEDLGVNYPILLSDGELEVAVGGIYGIPATFILDREGRIVYRHVGLADEAELRSTIEGLF